MKKTYKIDVECAACADKMEREAKELAGVKDISINFLTSKIKVEFQDGVEPTTMMPHVEKICKKIENDCKIYFE